MKVVPQSLLLSCSSCILTVRKVRGVVGQQDSVFGAAKRVREVTRIEEKNADHSAKPYFPITLKKKQFFPEMSQEIPRFSCEFD